MANKIKLAQFGQIEGAVRQMRADLSPFVLGTVAAVDVLSDIAVINLKLLSYGYPALFVPSSSLGADDGQILVVVFARDLEDAMSIQRQIEIEARHQIKITTVQLQAGDYLLGPEGVIRG